MQTFLPYPDFSKSASVLDKRRLGKQRVENLQIMQVLLGHRVVTTFARDVSADYDEEVVIGDVPTSEWFLEPLSTPGWARHPAVRMWRRYERGLMMYQQAICAEWLRRNFIDTCLDKTQFLFDRLGDPNGLITPPWMGDPGFHTSHQSNLIRKDRTYYSQFFPGVPGDLPYIWPV